MGLAIPERGATRVHLFSILGLSKIKIMKKFVVRILFFIIVFLGINLIFSNFVNPYYGNRLYNKKISYLLENKQDFNHIMLGSSRVAVHLNPKVIDDHTTNSCVFSTFNLGVASIYNPEAYYLYDEFLAATDVGDFDYATLELQNLNEIPSINLNTPRQFYWHNFEYFKFATQFLIAEDIPFKEKADGIESYLISYIKSLFFSNVALVYTTTLPITMTGEEPILGHNKDGFYSLEARLVDQGENSAVGQRKNNFLTHYADLIERRNNAAGQFTDQLVTPNPIHLEKANTLIQNSLEKGIHLFFIITPRVSDYNGLLAVANQLPPEHIILIANPNEYPELWATDMSFDVGHLNEVGATLYSEEVARHYSQICGTQ